MNERVAPPAPDDDVSTQEAANKAKGLLGEVNRVPSGFDDTGHILDKDGGGLELKAEGFAHTDAGHVNQIAKFEEKAKSNITRARTLEDAAGLTLATHDGDHAEAIKLLNADADASRDEADELFRMANQEETERKANLWEASQHAQANPAEYRAAAIEDANAAGHDITYDGIEYPAPESKPADENVTPSTDQAPQG